MGEGGAKEGPVIEVAGVSRIEAPAGREVGEDRLALPAEAALQIDTIAMAISLLL